MHNFYVILHRLIKNGTATFFKGRVTSVDGASAFVFASTAVLSHLRNAEQIHGDGTFATVPNMFYQMFTLHLVAFGKVCMCFSYMFNMFSKFNAFQAFPFAYVLMSDKSLSLYTAVMRKIVDTVEEEHPGDGFATRLLISDFEEAIIKSMGAAFPTARARGCWFHYGQVNF